MARGLHQNIRQPVAVAVLCDARGQHKQISDTHGVDNFGLIARAAPTDPTAYTKRLRTGFHGLRKVAAADMGPMPIQTVWQQCQCVDEIIKAFLFDHTTDRHHTESIVHAAKLARRRGREAAQIQAMIN